MMTRSITSYFAMCAGLGAVCFSAIISCDRSPPEPIPPQPNAPATSTDATSESYSGGAPLTAAEARSSSGGGSAGATTSLCLQPLAKEAPPVASSLKDCPPDPNGRPTMPTGTIRFAQAKDAPELTVELALNLDDQRHGLMFRSHLADSEGMLFTYRDQKPRHFWMHNTCLALDMIHIDQDNRIVGIVEQVPPWNDLTRSVRCSAKHVLEVPAGWSRRYGVFPGQIVQILTNESSK